MDSILNITLIVSLQVMVYVLFLRPKILSWGAHENEINMRLTGDELAPFISSTRAILIDAPVSEVWKVAIQLGADRGGFFSYSFVEKALGYKTLGTKQIPESYDMEVGRVIPGSMDESKSFIKYNFPVVAVESGKSFVLKEWGAFVLEEVNPTQTRLIVRTHGRKCPTFLAKLIDFIGTPLHYIMERRMMMGIKAEAEPGKGLSRIADNVWILGMLLSGMGIILLAFLGKGIPGILLSVIYGIVWLWPLLIFKPQPVFSLLLSLAIAATIVWL